MYTALCLQVAVSITQSTYTPPESFPLDPPPPYSTYSSIAQSESDNSDVFPQTLGIILIMQICRLGLVIPVHKPPNPSIISFVFLYIPAQTQIKKNKQKKQKFCGTEMKRRNCYNTMDEAILPSEEEWLPLMSEYNFYLFFFSILGFLVLVGCGCLSELHPELTV